MKSYIAKPSDIDRKWYVIDAEGKALGKLAVEAAMILKGKKKPIYTPHIDTGDYVIVINAEKAILTGNKLNQKMYYHHTGYVGHMKEVKYSTLMRTKPTFAMEKAIKGMIPDTTIGREALTRLRVYAGAEHKHAAQKPENYEI